MHARTFFTIAVLFLGGGCHAQGAARVDAIEDAKLADARQVTEQSIEYATCVDGSRIGPHCGLIMRVSSADDFRARFRDKICAGKTPDACDEAFRRMIDAELAKRYYAADGQGVQRVCDLHPGRCDDGVAYEKELMTSHNARVQARYAHAEEQIEGERALAHAREQAAAIGAVGVAMDTAAALSGGTVCHSYPSAFGGSTTVCSR
jgi:hypothetical protein